MTQKEMTELFAIMLLAYPNAEIFKGGIQKLAPTIELWTRCLPEVDYWTGQHAVLKLCRECKYPPTIADFKEKVEKTHAEIESKIQGEYLNFRSNANWQDTAYAYQVASAETKAVIDAMGGHEKMLIEHKYPNGQKEYSYAMSEFTSTYLSMLRQKAALNAAGEIAIGGPKQKMIGGKSS